MVNKSQIKLNYKKNQRGNFSLYSYATFFKGNCISVSLFSSKSYSFLLLPYCKD